jgi:hypothetical protein
MEAKLADKKAEIAEKEAMIADMEAEIACLGWTQKKDVIFIDL